jgi:hypothetical protein
VQSTLADLGESARFGAHFAFKHNLPGIIYHANCRLFLRDAQSDILLHGCKSGVTPDPEPSRWRVSGGADRGSGLTCELEFAVFTEQAVDHFVLVTERH